MHCRLIVLIAILSAATSSGCSDPDSGLTKAQVTQVLEIEQETQRESAELSQSRDRLEADRRLWSERERSDPIIAEAINNGILIVVCCLPLLLIVVLLLPARQEVPAELIREALVANNNSDRRRLDEPNEPSRRLD